MAAPKQESLATLLADMTPALEYLLRAPMGVLGRVALPTGEWLRRARALQAVVSEEEQSSLAQVIVALEALATGGPEEKRVRAKELISFVPRASAPAAPGDAPAPAKEPAEAELPWAEATAEYQPSLSKIDSAIDLLKKELQFVKGVGPRRAEILGKFGLHTLEDLVYHLPFRYEDRREVQSIGSVHQGESALVVGEITRMTERTAGRGNRRILEAVLRDPTGLIELLWFNQISFFRNKLHEGMTVHAYGAIERGQAGGRRIVHPEIDLSPTPQGPGVHPVYNKPTAMTVAAMRKVVHEGIRAILPNLPAVIPKSVADEAKILAPSAAFQEVHCPPSDADIHRLNSFRTAGHRSIVFEELFLLQLGLLLRRRHQARENGRSLQRTGTLVDPLFSHLPFRLTRAQERVIDEIEGDLARAHPMHRLVQGDVGSGKTIVALVAALIAAENNLQTAFMAPTELLAEQHYGTAKQFLDPLGVEVVLLTGQLPRGEKGRVYEKLASGAVQIAIGTHALIQDGAKFKELGLGIIDEQHRFGVLQRAALREASANAPLPDMLLMTATPIPRTLALTLYGDLDISVLDELPPGRKPVRTLVLRESERFRAYQQVLNELKQGRQGYIVYPLLEESEKEELRNAKAMADELGSGVFSAYRLGLVHGKMRSTEKDAVMRRFRAGELHVLVATTVVEVGVDVPNATIMVVEHAERFGLSQLHQLRGRVGRGADQATCILVGPAFSSTEVFERLRALASTTDGFRVAELDLQTRGPGDFIGTRQSGLPDFRAANLLRDSRLLTEARRLAENWLQHDPNLRSPESEGLRKWMMHRWRGRLGLAEVG